MDQWTNGPMDQMDQWTNDEPAEVGVSRSGP
jgi:hypothetical protein